MMPDPLPVDAIMDVQVDAPIDAEKPAPTQPTVGELLATSRSAHLRYHQFLPRMAAVGGIPQPQAGDSTAALSALKAAAAARAHAELIDPQHVDRSWGDDAQTSPHQDLLVFYLQQLSK